MASLKAPRATIVHAMNPAASGGLAFAHALKITLASKSQLCLLHVRGEDDAYFSRTQGLRQVRDALVRWNLLAKDAPYDHWEERLDLQVSSVSITARNARAGVLEFLDDRQCELVVLATHENRALTRWLDVSVQQGVLRKARMMSLFLRDGSRGFVDVETGALALKKALVPIDGALPSIVAIRRIQAILKLIASDASVQLLHVGDSAPKLADENGEPLNLPIIVRKGAVVDTILKVADDLKVDVIAMPTAGRHGLLDAVRGSTTARVLDDASWPLLAVPVG
ncbi:MAG TPA: universal stress protein [Roseiarcus sp.]|nr:universal stress protein [Roseiarcus sp.]